MVSPFVYHDVPRTSGAPGGVKVIAPSGPPRCLSRKRSITVRWCLVVAWVFSAQPSSETISGCAHLGELAAQRLANPPCGPGLFRSGNFLGPVGVGAPEPAPLENKSIWQARIWNEHPCCHTMRSCSVHTTESPPPLPAQSLAKRRLYCHAIPHQQSKWEDDIQGHNIRYQIQSSFTEVKHLRQALGVPLHLSTPHHLHILSISSAFPPPPQMFPTDPEKFATGFGGGISTTYQSDTNCRHNQLCSKRKVTGPAQQTAGAHGPTRRPPACAPAQPHTRLWRSGEPATQNIPRRKVRIGGRVFIGHGQQIEIAGLQELLFGNCAGAVCVRIQEHRIQKFLLHHWSCCRGRTTWARGMLACSGV